MFDEIDWERELVSSSVFPFSSGEKKRRRIDIDGPLPPLFRNTNLESPQDTAPLPLLPLQKVDFFFFVRICRPAVGGMAFLFLSHLRGDILPPGEGGGLQGGWWLLYGCSREKVSLLSSDSILEWFSEAVSADEISRDEITTTA